MRLDQKLSKDFKKDEHFEFIIKTINNKLFEEHNSLLKEKGDLFPTIHVIGAPRSGTTLLTQILASYLGVGYINNLIAAFYKVPLIGIALSKKLLDANYKSNFESIYGRTKSIEEPHEFGYFWNEHLSYPDLAQQSNEIEESINWEYLSLILNNITYSFDKPVIFKSFLLGFHARKFCQVNPKSIFIYTKRDFLSNAVSILNLRKKLNGNINEWGSLKPKQYNVLKELTVHEQITGQILFLEHEYLAQLKNVAPENKILISYESACANPQNFINNVFEKIMPMCKIEKRIIDESLAFPYSQANVDEENRELFLNAKRKIERVYPNLMRMENQS